MPKARPTRRRLLRGVGAALTVGAGWLTLRPPSANAYYNGPVSDHFDGVEFFNKDHAPPKSFAELLRWNIRERSATWPDSFPSPHAPLTADRLSAPVAGGRAEGVRIVYVGHASFLIQAQGHSILIDPVWSKRASPVPFAGPTRRNPPGIPFDALPRIDTVVLTHNHYDHMDAGTLAKLWQRFRPRFFMPLGNDTIVRKEVFSGGTTVPSGLRLQAVDWGDTIELAAGLKLHTVPTLHWSARGMRDRRHALWASYVLETPSRRLYCVGDTGFGDGSVFRGIKERFGAVDMALLPIGAYEPRWFMKDQHMNPADAVAAFELLGAARAIGHHWGTFKLTNEAIDAPAQDLALALAARGIPPDRFEAVRPGAVVELG